MEKIYRVKLNSKGEPNFSTAVEIEDIPIYGNEHNCMMTIFGECSYAETGCGDCAVVEKVRKALSADRRQGEWIPCSERLPKIGEHHISEPCLVYCKGGVYAFAELEENIFGQVGWNCERDDDYHEPIGEVTAWMPLPKPCGEREGE